MISGDNSSSTSYTHVGKAIGTGIVIGDNSSVVIGQTQHPMQVELLRKLEEFTDLLAFYESSVEDAPDVLDSLLEAQREVREPEPRWPMLRVSLRRIAASVSGVAALTEAVNNILALLSRIPR